MFLKCLALSINHVIKAAESVWINWLVLLPTSYFCSSLFPFTTCSIAFYPEWTCVMEAVLPITSNLLDPNCMIETCIVTELIVFATHFSLSLLFWVLLHWALAQSPVYFGYSSPSSMSEEHIMGCPCLSVHMMELIPLLHNTGNSKLN
jgi:hypothetical protein